MKNRQECPFYIKWKPRFAPTSIQSLITLLLFAPILLRAQDAPTEPDIRDIRGPIEIPEPPPYGLWIAIALGIFFLGILISSLLKNRIPAKSLTPAQRAFAKLDEARPLMEKESAEPFADAVAQVIRDYIDARFGISAPRRTTEEFLRQLDPVSSAELNPYSEELGKFLRYCDATKFGGRQIDSEKRQQLLDSARQFVEVTAVPETTSNPK